MVVRKSSLKIDSIHSATPLWVGALALAINLATVQAANELWIAFNESFPGPDTHSNVTTWSPFGTDYGASGQTGLLKDIKTGANLEVSLAIANRGAGVGSTGGIPAVGTPAYTTFNGVIDWSTGYFNYDAISLTNGATLTHTFRGLDPGKRYTFKGTAVRGNAAYTDRWTLLEIVDAESFIGRHTGNVLTEAQLPGQLARHQAAMNTGNNTSGDMVVWEKIAPNSNVTFSVVSSKFSGTVPGGSTSGAHGYGLEAIRLEAYEAGALVSIISPADGAAIQGPTNIAISVDAWSPVGISNVLFFANNSLIGEASASPYCLVWSNAGFGSHVLTAVAIDSLGAGTTSSVVGITVKSPPLRRVALVPSNAVYRWRPGIGEASAPVDAWREPGFDDSTWTMGLAPFYYDEAPTAQSTYAGNTLIPDMQYNFTCVFLRHSFVVANAAAFTNLVLRHHVDDGMVVWLNGTKILQVNLRQWNGASDAHADDNAPEPAPDSLLNVPYPAPLVNGTNVLAIQCFNDSIGSSDLLMDADLTAELMEGSVLPPGVLTASPPVGVVHALRDVTVTFTKPVTNVQCGDLLVNGSAAVSVDGSAATYTFAFPQPAFGPVSVTWATRQAIQDLDVPPKPFNSVGVVFKYVLADSNAPAMATQNPPAGATVSNLTQIQVTFSKPVTNVSAGDLLLNGAPATGVTGADAIYTFTFPQPAYGTILVTWSVTNRITAVDAPPTAFDRTLPEASWRYALVDLSPPVVIGIEPTVGTFVSNLTQMTIVFSEAVSGVDAPDLLINGRPATGVSGSGASYTFTFPPPNAAQVAVTLTAAHGITDLAVPPNAFNANACGQPWRYSTLDAVPPAVVSVYPPAGLRVRSLEAISVTFDEPVTGVTAEDLLVSGQSANQVIGSAAGPYIFLFRQPASTGPVQIAWASGHGIQDLTAPPNAFGGGAWTNLLDPSLPHDLAVKHVIHISVDGLGGFYLREYLSHAPALFPSFTRLRNQGAATFDARCDYSNSLTLPNHTSMLTGRPVLQPAGWPDTLHHGIEFDSDNGRTVHNSGNPKVLYQASVLDVVHDHGLSTAFYSSKDKFIFYLRSYDAINGAGDHVDADNGHNKIDMSLLTDGGDDAYDASEALVSKLVADLAGTPGNYTFLHFAEPDYVGHDNGWGSSFFSNAVRHVDQQLGRILTAVEANPKLTHQVAIVLTADHGGGGNTATGHGTTSKYKNFAIPFFAWGTGIPAGADLYSLLVNRGDPGTNRLDYNATPQPLRNGDSGNLALALLGLPSVPDSTIIPVLGTAPIPLSIAKSDTTFMVSWPVTTNAFHLQVAPAFGSPLDWQAISEGITTNGPFRVFLAPRSVDSPMLFFRLKKF